MDTSDESGLNAPPLIRDMQTCKTCGSRFMVVDWLAWRLDGYCSKSCLPWRDDSAGKEAA